MTEEEWINETSPGTLVEAVRRRTRFRNEVTARKSRLAACAILRLVIPHTTETSWMEPIEVAELYADGRARFAEIVKAIESSTETILGGSTWCTSHTALQCLTQADPLDSAYRAGTEADRFLELTPEGRTEDKASMLRTDTAHILHDLFGNPFRPVAFDPNWRTSTVVSIAQGVYETRDFAPMPILADALQDAGCEHADILDHCRGAGPHVRGCWVVDLVLGKA